jgi:DNA-binding NtrC family response regulator
MAFVQPEDGFLIKSPRMIAVYEEIYDYAFHDQPCIFLGPSGVGKEFAAKYYHKIWQRNKNGIGPFLTANCGTFTETIAISEIFGHKKGSFTGAYKDKEGLVEEAKGGILFLDEIGDLPKSVQSMLLRAIDPATHQGRRLGSNTFYSTEHVRFLAATEKPMKSIRPALLARLGMRITIPGLDERPEDRKTATEYFTLMAILKRKDLDLLYKSLFGQANPHQKDKSEMMNDARLIELGKLVSDRLNPLVSERSWPENFRLLRNAVDSGVIRAKDMSAEDRFAGDVQKYFTHCLSTYSGDKTLIQVGGLNRPPDPDEAKIAALHERLQSALPSAREDEKEKWARFLNMREGRNFLRRDIDLYFHDDAKKIRTRLNRINSLIDAGIIARTGRKREVYRLIGPPPPADRSGIENVDVFPLPFVRKSVLVNAEEETAIRDLLRNARHVFLSTRRMSHSEEWVLTLGHLLKRDREVHYYRVKNNSLIPFLAAIADAVFRQNAGDNPVLKSVKTTPPDLVVTILTGYTERLFSRSSSPLIILSDIQNVMRSDERKAVACMLRYWHPLQFILTGSKLPFNPESNPGLDIIES